MTNMLQGFALYKERELTHRECFIGQPPGTRLYGTLRIPGGWRIWIATNDFQLGTYLELYNDGRVYRVTSRRDEGDSQVPVRPSDDVIRRDG